MLRSRILRLTAVVPLLTVAAHRAMAPATVQLDLATIHAAALTTPRVAGDSVDHPYVLLSVLGPGATRTATTVPTGEHPGIVADQALGSRSLTRISLAEGDSVRLLLALLESEALSDAEHSAAEAATAVLTRPRAARPAALAGALAPLMATGARVIGAASLLVTNVHGQIFWRALDCVTTCAVLNPPGEPLLAPNAAKPAAGVVELTGAGGTYHVQVTARRVE